MLNDTEHWCLVPRTHGHPSSVFQTYNILYMETEFPLKDLILYRISQNRSLLELEIFGNFKAELQKLLRSGIPTKTARQRSRPLSL